ncbi:GRB2-associated-binding protein 2 [Sciurus carolinensis]|uniref:GRB2-associated-binding protein 2 n=1 Tax=Sciurus carolinensis TaxID=30640 RepID=A0AA41N459_SCICA|nr:GRB2-associated-binding protein 2 [Sciurus carolinensis]
MPRSKNTEGRAQSQSPEPRMQSTQQPALLTGKPPEWEEAQPTWSSRSPQHLHPCLHLDKSKSHGAESARSDNVSQACRNSFLVKSDIATQNVAQGGGPCVPGIHGQAQGLCIPSNSHWHSLRFGHHCCSFPQHVASRSHTTGSPTGRKDPYIFMAPIKTPLSAFQIATTSIMDKSHSSVAVAATGNKAMSTPSHPHKPSQVETPQQSCTSKDSVARKKDTSVSFAATMPCCRVYHAVDSSHHHQASFPEACKNYLWGTKSAELSADSRAHGDNFHQAAEIDVGHLDEVVSEDEYMPMSTLPSILLVMGIVEGNAQIIHKARSPGSPHFVTPSCSPAALLSHKDIIRGNKIQPPTFNHSLKPGWKGKCTLSVFHLLTTSRLCSFYQLSDASCSWG